MNSDKKFLGEKESEREKETKLNLIMWILNIYKIDSIKSAIEDFSWNTFYSWMIFEIEII